MASTGFVIKTVLSFFLLNSGDTVGDQSFPSLAAIDDDSFMAVYVSNQFDAGEIESRTFRLRPSSVAGVDAADATSLVASNGHVATMGVGLQTGPVVSRTADGTFVVAWQNLQSSFNIGAAQIPSVMTRQFASDGVTPIGLDADVDIMPSSAVPILLASKPSGGVVAFWSAVFGGAKSKLLFSAGAPSAERGETTSAIMLRNGGRATATGTAGDPTISTMKIFDPAGSVVKSVAIAHQPMSGEIWAESALGELRDGRVVFAIETQKPDVTEKAPPVATIATYLVVPDAATQADLLIPNRMIGPIVPTGYVRHPKTTTLSSGHIVITWVDVDPVGLTWTIRADVLDQAFNRIVTGAALTSGDLGHAPHHYAILALSEGRLAIAFDNQFDGDHSGINLAVVALVRTTQSGETRPETLSFSADDLRNDIQAGSGGDRIVSGKSKDTIAGGPGDDFLDGGAGDDFMKGGEGSDTYVVTDPGDRVEEADGMAEGANDTVATILPTYKLPLGVENLQAVGTLPENARLGVTNWGGNALNNTILGTAESDFIAGNAGRDVIQGYGRRDLLFGGSGDDLIYGGEGNDMIGNDVLSITGSSVESRAAVPTEHDEFVGGPGPDQFIASASQEFFVGGPGPSGGDDPEFDDVSYELSPRAIGINLVDGRQNTGWAFGDRFNMIDGFLLTAYDDRFVGSESSEVVIGGGGDDVIATQGGDDKLLGFEGDDQLYGGEGDDFLWGGDYQGRAGNDILSGGSGRDLFAYTIEARAPNPCGQDVITDFEDGIDLLQFTPPEQGPVSLAALAITGNGSSRVVISYPILNPTCRIELRSPSAINISGADFTYRP